MLHLLWFELLVDEWHIKERKGSTGWVNGNFIVRCNKVLSVTSRGVICVSKLSLINN